MRSSVSRSRSTTSDPPLCITSRCRSTFGSIGCTWSCRRQSAGPTRTCGRSECTGTSGSCRGRHRAAGAWAVTSPQGVQGKLARGDREHPATRPCNLSTTSAINFRAYPGREQHCQIGWDGKDRNLPRHQGGWGTTRSDDRARVWARAMVARRATSVTSSRSAECRMIRTRAACFCEQVAINQDTGDPGLVLGSSSGANPFVARARRRRLSATVASDPMVRTSLPLLLRIYSMIIEPSPFPCGPVRVLTCVGTTFGCRTSLSARTPPRCRDRSSGCDRLGDPCREPEGHAPRYDLRLPHRRRMAALRRQS